MEILLADDERLIRKSLTALLEENGYVVRVARDGDEALALYRAHRPDLLLLDVMMPRKNGFEVCEEIRRDDDETPILFLTALEDEKGELRGIEAGCDAYVLKTVSDDVLLARLSAALRHWKNGAPSDRFDFAGADVDPRRLTARLPSGEEVMLNERELALLRWFSRYPGEVYSRDFLVTRFWNGDLDCSDNTLSTAMHRLRDKLGPSGLALRTVRGSGYTYRYQQS